MELAREFETLVKDAATALGRKLGTEQLTAAREAAQKEMLDLSLIVGEPGYELALVASRDVVALKLGLKLVTGADAADDQLVGLIQGALGIAARALC